MPKTTTVTTTAAAATAATTLSTTTATARGLLGPGGSSGFPVVLGEGHMQSFCQPICVGLQQYEDLCEEGTRLNRSLGWAERSGTDGMKITTKDTAAESWVGKGWEYHPPG
ncbi:unnamed protein product, partial [Discosporangium mesarthrocarpum]